MTAFVDSSILVTAFLCRDPRHEASLSVLERYSRERIFTSGHSLAEAFAVVTGFPGKWRTAPRDALLFLADVRDRLTLCALDPEEYFLLAERCANRGDIGGSIYDALIGVCALKSGADVLYSWNARDFQRLFPEKRGWAVTPEQDQ